MVNKLTLIMKAMKRKRSCYNILYTHMFSLLNNQLKGWMHTNITPFLCCQLTFVHFTCQWETVVYFSQMLDALPTILHVKRSLTHFVQQKHVHSSSMAVHKWLLLPSPTSLLFLLSWDISIYHFLKMSPLNITCYCQSLALKGVLGIKWVGLEF